MKEFNLSIPWMYFTGIEQGEISVLFFEKLPYGFEEVEKGDLIKIETYGNVQKMYFDHSLILPFKDIDDSIARKAGFATRELLSAHLASRFDIKKYEFTTTSKIDRELFYVVFLTDDPEKVSFSDGECSCKFDKYKNIKYTTIDNKKIQEWCKGLTPYRYSTSMGTYKEDFYNPEYDDKPWS